MSGFITISLVRPGDGTKTLTPAVGSTVEDLRELAAIADDTQINDLNGPVDDDEMLVADMVYSTSTKSKNAK